MRSNIGKLYCAEQIMHEAPVISFISCRYNDHIYGYSGQECKLHGELNEEGDEREVNRSAIL